MSTLDKSVGHLTRKSGVLVRYPVWQHTFVSPSASSRRAVVSYWQKYVHEVLVNRLGGLSLPRKSVVRLTGRPDMTIDVYRGRKTTMQHQQQLLWILCLMDNFISNVTPFHQIDTVSDSHEYRSSSARDVAAVTQFSTCHKQNKLNRACYFHFFREFLASIGSNHSEFIYLYCSW